MDDKDKKPQRALITYRTKELKANAKWPDWREREIDAAKDGPDAMAQFYDRRTWPSMTGAIEVRGITWLRDDGSLSEEVV